MDFGFTPEQEALRRDVRAFIAEHMTPEVLAEMEGLNEGFGVSRSPGRGPHIDELFGKIGERGWLGISYPKEYGGQDGDRITQYIVEEEFARVNIAVGLAGSGAPAVLAAGTEEQKRHFIPRLVSGEYSFALGFTEPQAGADLASLQCRAVRDGDEYVINGQKMYTSSAHMATHIYLMARTNPDVPKHRGISIFLIPMDAPGITVRPLWTIQNDPRAPLGTTFGTSRTNETFFDDVRALKSTLLGKENDGWGVGSMGLNLDRVGAARYLISVRRDEDIINWVKANRFNGYSPADDPGQDRGALDRGPGVPAHDHAEHVHRRARRQLHLRGLGGEGVGARARGQDVGGHHPDAGPLWPVAERLATGDRERDLRPPPDWRLSVRDQPRQRPGHAGSGGATRPRSPPRGATPRRA